LPIVASCCHSYPTVEFFEDAEKCGIAVNPFETIVFVEDRDDVSRAGRGRPLRVAETPERVVVWSVPSRELFPAFVLCRSVTETEFHTSVGCIRLNSSPLNFCGY
jgi:hypothetical protein